ncbi:MAG: Rrf2 family transcriptional regulator [Bacteroidetes bacterium]|nr:Rrf2 family transcriptional regulator [Bacteroidota bacterium]
MFSKASGYAIRATVFLSSLDKPTAYTSPKYIAENLNIPVHYTVKILRRLAAEKIIDSSKGPNGGYRLNKQTLSTPLLKILEVLGDESSLTSCALSLSKCSSQDPCLIHHMILPAREQLQLKFRDVTINDLLSKSQ